MKRTHGESGNPKKGIKTSSLYMVWRNMKNRCNNKRTRQYPQYGGRGIKVCAEWNTYEKFKEDMEPNFIYGLTLDRIDNNKGYSKKNCRWTSQANQQNNKRNNRCISFEGETMTLRQWGIKLGIKKSTLGQRYYVYKWPIKKCLTYAR